MPALGKSMSKADLVLAQKTFAANKLKWELKQLKTKGGDVTMDGASLARSKSLPQFDSMKMSQGSGPEQLQQQQQQQQQMFSPVKHVVGSTFGGDAEGKHSDDEVAVGLRKINVKELGTRGTTPATNLRKTNLTVSKSVLESKGNDPRLRTDPEALFAELSRENYYLPKVTITRPDGATLMDIYRSKQADTWARILKAQIREDEDNKLKFKHDRETMNASFAKQVRQDLDAIALRKGSTDNSDSVLLAIQEAAYKKADDVQRKRAEDATTRQKQFIAYALQDIDVKSDRRARELEREIEASTMTINKVKAEIAVEEKKVADKKAVEAKRLERLFQENQANLRRKEELRQKQFEEDRRIFREAEAAAKREDARRAFDLAKKTKQTTDGPAHGVTRQIKESFKTKEEALYSTLYTTDNLLNKQLLGSEEFTAARLRNAGKGLTAEWDKNMAIKMKAKAEEDERVRKIGEYNAKKLKEMALQDEAVKEKKRDAALTYQRELDKQLGIVRSRQILALTRTMSEEEELYNASLMRKYVPTA